MNSLTGMPNMPFSKNNLINIPVNPVFFVIFIVIILFFILLFGNLGNDNNLNNNEYNTGAFNGFGILIISILLLLVVINGFTYFYNIDIVAKVKNMFTKNPEIDLHVNTKNNILKNNLLKNNKPDEVFHITNNKFNYENARAVCKAYNSRLATYKEIEDAYNEGAEWCNYGWSADQFALYPTQHESWKKLQKVKNHENDCGRPGINGGYIDNPNVRFGVNCYGQKPKQTPLESSIMENNKDFPVTIEGKQFKEKIDYWKNNINDIIISPFNRNDWSKI